jgi:hypothetical protein
MKISIPHGQSPFAARDRAPARVSWKLSGNARRYQTAKEYSEPSSHAIPRMSSRNELFLPSFLQQLTMK